MGILNSERGGGAGLDLMTLDVFPNLYDSMESYKNEFALEDKEKNLLFWLSEFQYTL